MKTSFDFHGNLCYKIGGLEMVGIYVVQKLEESLE